MAPFLRSMFVFILCGAGCVGPNANVPPAKPGDCNARTEAQPYTALGVRRPMAKLGRTTVQTYRWTANAARIAPCSVLLVKKEIGLQRERGAQGVLKEVREFYAEDGTLIVRNTEDVTKQLARSGQYAGSVSLPIPASAPAGHYRIVSKLILEMGERSKLLARAIVNFQVAAREDVAPRPMTTRSPPPRVLKNGVP